MSTGGKRGRKGKGKKVAARGPGSSIGAAIAYVTVCGSLEAAQRGLDELAALKVL